VTYRLGATAAPAAGPVTSPGSGRRRAMAALVRMEATRLARHPGAVVALLLACLGLYALTDARTARFPILQDADQLAQPVLALLLGGVALVLSNAAVLRAHRHGAEAALAVLVLPDRWRAAAHLLALTPLALLAAAVAAGHIALLAALPGAAGRPNGYELATGPVLVLLLGATGVLLGHLFRTVVAGPLTMVAFAAITLVSVALVPPDAGQPNPLVPILRPTSGDPLLGPAPLPVDLMTRPAGRHLAYLAGLLALVTTVALLRAGRADPTRGAHGRSRLAVAFLAALVLTVGAGAAQAAASDPSIVNARAAATQRPASRQRCRTIQLVTYCAFPGFEPWVAGWNDVVRGVLRRVPPSVAAQPLAVRQRVVADATSNQQINGVTVPPPVDAWRADDSAAGTPNAITAGTWWGDGWSETGLAGRVAYELITHSGPGVTATLCGARGVLVGWLAGQATADTRAGLRTIAGGSRGGAVAFTEAGFGSSLVLTDPELTMVWALLDRPADEVGKRVLDSWAELSASGTSLEQAAKLLGVAVPSGGSAEGARQCG